MAIETGTGYYDWRELEAMSTDRLREIYGWAADAFASHLNDEHTGAACERCEYLELLAGAADDLLAKREGN